MSFNGLLQHSCTLQRRYESQEITYSGASGSPTIGDTITGATSLSTAIVTHTGTDYVVVKQLSGDFTVGEVISVGITFSATVVSQADYRNATGEPEYYWKDDQTGIKCRFYYSSHGSILGMTEKGVLVMKPLQAVLPASATISNVDYRLVTTEPAFAGTYNVSVLPRLNYQTTHHYEVVLQKAQT